MVSISRLINSRIPESLPEQDKAKSNCLGKISGRIRKAWESIKSKVFKRPLIRSTTTIETISLEAGRSSRLSRLYQKVSNYFFSMPKGADPKVDIEMQFLNVPSSSFEGIAEIVKSRDSTSAPGVHDHPDAFMLALEMNIAETESNGAASWMIQDSFFE